MNRAITSLAVCSLVLASLAWAEKPMTKVSDAVTAPRPAEGEYFGLYLMGKKVGTLFSRVTVGDGTLTSVSQYHFKANVGPRVSERHMKETRVYETKPRGRLLSLKVEQSGDGGDQILEGTAMTEGLRVLRKRPGQPNETLTVKAPREVVEDADQARVSLKRRETVEGTIVDGTDLEQYKLVSKVGSQETRLIRGVQVKLQKISTVSDKEKVPTEAWFDGSGRIVEIHFGPTMTARAEPEAQAKRFDVVEVFGLTRVTLPKPLPASAFAVPGSATLTVMGLEDKFMKNTYRQQFSKQQNGRVEMAVTAKPPTQRAMLPLKDPGDGANLKSTIIVEADNPAIVAQAKKIIGDEKDAYVAARAIARWVFSSVKKDYGASSDRATDVLKTMRGDCTEHSLLAVALMRAVGIPAKRIDGLIYMVNDDKAPAYYWHEWVEAYVGEWTQLDPTFGEDVAKATHFAVGEEGNAEITPLIGALQVVEVR
jgi:hypothetical protein